MNAAQRSALYKSSAVLGVVVLATLLTIGIVTRGQVQEWIGYLSYGVVVVAGIIQTIVGFIARLHVTPDPSPDDTPPVNPN